jgi:MSHA pilin protein MshC
MKSTTRGFTLIELVSVLLLVGIMSIGLMSRMGAVNTAAVEAGRDDIIAALFFAQQLAMVRAGISVEITATTIAVKENLVVLTSPVTYPLTMPSGINLSTAVPLLVYDKLGQTTPTTINVMGSGNTQGTSVLITLEASGYAY